MDLRLPDLGPPSRLRALLEHFALIKDPRQPHRVAYPLPELLLLAVCGTIVDCDDYDAIASWGEAHLDFLRGWRRREPRGESAAVAASLIPKSATRSPSPSSQGASPVPRWPAFTTSASRPCPGSSPNIAEPLLPYNGVPTMY